MGSEEVEAERLTAQRKIVAARRAILINRPAIVRCHHLQARQPTAVAAAAAGSVSMGFMRALNTATASQ